MRRQQQKQPTKSREELSDCSSSELTISLLNGWLFSLDTWYMYVPSYDQLSHETCWDEPVSYILMSTLTSIILNYLPVCTQRLMKLVFTDNLHKPPLFLNIRLKQTTTFECVKLFLLF